MSQKTFEELYDLEVAKNKELEQKLGWISGWLLENVEYKKFNEVYEWGKATEDLLAKASGLPAKSIKESH